MQNGYSKRFMLVLEKEIQPEEISPERQAMVGTLDKGVSPDQYDIPGPRVSHNEDEKARQIEELKQWIVDIENFAEFLNAPNANSIQSKLHAAGCNTLFEHIAKSEKKKLSRIAAELSTLSETLKGYMISSNGN